MTYQCLIHAFFILGGKFFSSTSIIKPYYRPIGPASLVRKILGAIVEDKECAIWKSLMDSVEFFGRRLIGNKLDQI